MLSIRFLDALPDTPPVCAQVRQKHVTIALLVQPLDFDCLAFSKFNRRPRIQKLLRGDQTLKFSAHIHDDACFDYRKHASVENLSFRNRGCRR